MQDVLQQPVAWRGMLHGDEGLQADTQQCRAAAGAASEALQSVVSIIKLCPADDQQASAASLLCQGRRDNTHTILEFAAQNHLSAAATFSIS